jgi:hypothetical protein
VSGIFRGDVTVRNLLLYPIGTANGTVADSGGVKVFFNSGPVTTGGSGSVVVFNPDGVATFTAANQPFFKYPEMLGFNQPSAPRTWQFQLDPGVTDFSFTLLLEARIPASAFTVLEPGYGAIVTSDTLRIIAQPVNPAAIDSMRATVKFRSTPLAPADSGLWKGKLYIPGLGGPDSLFLRVVAHSATDSTVVLVYWDDGGLEGIRRR